MARWFVFTLTGAVVIAACSGCPMKQEAVPVLMAREPVFPPLAGLPDSPELGQERVFRISPESVWRDTGHGKVSDLNAHPEDLRRFPILVIRPDPGVEYPIMEVVPDPHVVYNMPVIEPGEAVKNTDERGRLGGQEWLLRLDNGTAVPIEPSDARNGNSPPSDEPQTGGDEE